MHAGEVETILVAGSWINQIEGQGPTDDRYDSKDEAVDAGREIAKVRGVVHVVRNEDGTEGERVDYGPA